MHVRCLLAVALKLVTCRALSYLLSLTPDLTVTEDGGSVTLAVLNTGGAATSAALGTRSRSRFRCSSVIAFVSLRMSAMTLSCNMLAIQTGHTCSDRTAVG